MIRYAKKLSQDIDKKESKRPIILIIKTIFTTIKKVPIKQRIGTFFTKILVRRLENHHYSLSA